ncbi:MAG: M35 family metallo-endopeptidase [Bacteroidia bacterium]|nr:M35 family metallo-endopeptidase [Bacteroidia bacterium]
MIRLKHILYFLAGLLTIGQINPAYSQTSIPPIIRGLPKDSAQKIEIEYKILLAHEDAKRIMEDIVKAYQYISRFENTDSLVAEWNSHPSFPLWFGKVKDDPSFVFEVGKRLKILRDWLNNEQITYRLRLGALSYCELSHSTAYTSQLNKNKVINLCPYWLRCREDQRASTVVHELVHKMGFGHPGGATYPAKAIILARMDSQKASKSPENYEGLVESFFRDAQSNRN